MTAATSLAIEHHPHGVVVLSLNRPQRKNALDRELVLALGGALAEFGSSATNTGSPGANDSAGNIKVIVLSGEGGAFCSGADLTSISGASSDEIKERIDEFHLMIRGIVGAIVPVVAAIEGPAVGFGADLALACDMRIMSESGYLEEGFAKIGLMPDGGGTLWLEKFVGPRAFEFLALGTRLSAEDCLRWGIANALVPAGQALSRALVQAEQLAQAAPLALRAIKQSLRAGENERLESTLMREKAGQAALIGSQDFQEGVSAFLGKRPPQFRGK